MMKPFVLIIYCLLLIGIHESWAQSYSSVHYDTKDGLPSATVYDISQDKDGFMWFGTENGLCRFDGKNFKTFTTKDGLPDNSILKVHADNSGRVYFTPFTHSLYYYESDSFHKFPVPEKYADDLSNVSMFANSGKKVVISGSAESYSIEKGQIASLHDGNGKFPRSVLVHRAYDTVIVAGTPDSFYLLSASGNMRSLPFDTTFNMIFDADLNVHRLHIAKYHNFRLVGYVGHDLFYWIWGNTVNIFNCSNGNRVCRMNIDKFSKAFIDNEDNLWISTLGNGVYRYPSFGFRNMDFGGQNEIFSIVAMDDQLLSGSDYSKVYTMSPAKGDSQYFTTNLSRLIDSSDNPISYLTNRNRIYVQRFEGGYLYIGTDAFLIRKSRSGEIIVRNIFPVKDIDIRGEKMLVCTGQSALLLNRHDMSIRDTLLKQRSTCGAIYHGHYYVGTLGGLVRIDSTSKKVIALYNKFPPFKGRITAIRLGNNDDLWIATSGSGLINFKSDSIVRILREKDGLTSDICTALFIDDSLIWLGTNSGLNRIEVTKKDWGVTRFTSANGLGADFINAILATDSSICVGSAAGLTMFSKNILTEKSVCILHILEVSENGIKLNYDASYSFPYNALNIQVDFTAISFKSAGDITYYYQLKGLDNNWNTTRANFVNFSTLPPGHYTFYLKAINKFGIESETKAINITIRPPWWQTWAFIIGALLATALMIFLIYTNNIRNIRRKEATKREIETRFAALEQKALQAQMNPHFIFNCLNSIQTFILNFDAEGANSYLTTFASLIRQTLDNSMQPLITVGSEIKYLETYLGLEKLRFRDKFRYEIKIDENIDVNNTLLPGMLLQPYIENSIRHGIQHRKDNNGLIRLTIQKTIDDVILYTITDNGVGRKAAQALRSSRHIEYQSRGMSINEKRVAAINSQFSTDIRVKTEDVTDDTGTVVGTTVSVFIPSFHK